MNDGIPTTYFLDPSTDKIDTSRLPPSARDVVVARVRVTQGPSYHGPRHPTDVAVDQIPKDSLACRIRIIELYAGSAQLGSEFDVVFGPRDQGLAIVAPHTPEQLNRDYNVAMYVDARDGQRRLLGFPMSDVEYLKWRDEYWKYEKTRGRPGVPQK